MMTERHLTAVDNDTLPISSDQIRELRQIGQRFGISLMDEPIDTRPVSVSAAEIGCMEEASAELKRQGFLLLPGALDQVVRRWHGDETA